MTWIESKIQELEASKKLVVEREVERALEARIMHMEKRDRRMSVDQLGNYTNPKIVDAKTHRDYYEEMKGHTFAYGPDKPFSETALKFDNQLQLAQDLAKNHLGDLLVPFPEIIYEKNADEWRMELNERVGPRIIALHDRLFSPLLREGISGLRENSHRMKQIRKFNNADYESSGDEDDKQLPEGVFSRQFPKLDHVRLTVFELDVFVNPLLDVGRAISMFTHKCIQFYAFRDAAIEYCEDRGIKITPIISHCAPEFLKKLHPVHYIPIIDNFIEPSVIKWIWKMWCSLLTGGRECVDYVEQLKVMSIHCILGAHSLPYKGFAGEMKLTRDPEQPKLINMRSAAESTLQVNDMPMVLCCNAPHLYREIHFAKHIAFHPEENSGCFLIRGLVDGNPYWISLLALAVSNHYDSYFKNLWISVTSSELRNYYEELGSEKQANGLCYNPKHLEEPEFAWLKEELRVNTRMQDMDVFKTLCAKYDVIHRATFVPKLSDNDVNDIAR